MYRCLRCGGTERSCPACGYDVEYCGEWSDDGYDYDELL